MVEINIHVRVESIALEQRILYNFPSKTDHLTL